jgi:hypothetical protein
LIEILNVRPWKHRINEILFFFIHFQPEYYRDAPQFRSVVGNESEYRLEIPQAKIEYTGTYSVVASNCYGQTKAIISLQIYAKGTFYIVFSNFESHRPKYTQNGKFRFVYFDCGENCLFSIKYQFPFVLHSHCNVCVIFIRKIENLNCNSIIKCTTYSMCNGFNKFMQSISNEINYFRQYYCIARATNQRAQINKQSNLVKREFIRMCVWVSAITIFAHLAPAVIVVIKQFRVILSASHISYINHIRAALQNGSNNKRSTAGHEHFALIVNFIDLRVEEWENKNKNSTHFHLCCFISFFCFNTLAMHSCSHPSEIVCT